jgi:hypothetical protein
MSLRVVRLSHRAVISTIRGSYRINSLSVHEDLKLAKARASRYAVPVVVAMISSISEGKFEQIKVSDCACASAQEQFTAILSWATDELSPVFKVEFKEISWRLKKKFLAKLGGSSH